MRSLVRMGALMVPLALAGSLAAPRAAAPEAPLDPLAAALQQRMDRLDSLQGRFTQRLESQSLGQPRPETGRFFLKKPSRMRWEYERPERKLAVTDGQVTWLYLPDEREAHRGTLASQEESGGAALLLAGRLRLDRDFTVRRLGAEEAAALGPQGVARAGILELVPLKRAADYERILLVLDAPTAGIRRIVVIDALGDRMSFELRDLEENREMPESLFQFTPPAGVEVIDLP